jgi:hypothetical protein
MAETIAIECPECGGSGFWMDMGCCGNVGPSGECRGYCVIPEQAPCDACGGIGEIYALATGASQ